MVNPYYYASTGDECPVCGAPVLEGMVTLDKWCDNSSCDWNVDRFGARLDS